MISWCKIHIYWHTHIFHLKDIIKLKYFDYVWMMCKVRSVKGISLLTAFPGKQILQGLFKELSTISGQLNTKKKCIPLSSYQLSDKPPAWLLDKIIQ